MNKNDVSNYMKQNWNNRANKDSFHYVETKYWNGDIEDFFRLGEERTCKLVDPVIAELGISTKDKTALDVGCGVGRFCRAFTTRFAKITGVDVSEIMIKKAKELHPIDVFSGLSFEVSDGLSMPIADASVDFAYSYEVFQHMPSHEVIVSNLKEIGRVLTADGHGLLHFRTTPGRFNAGQIYRDNVPDNVDRIVKRLFGKDQMTADAAFRGAPAFSREQIKSSCASAGLEILRFADDPTHAPGSRVFAVVRNAAGGSTE